MSILNNEEHFIANTKKALINTDGTPQTNAQRLQKLQDDWVASPENQELMARIRDPRHGGLKSMKFMEVSSLSTQLNYLFGRVAKNAVRNPLIIKARLGQNVVMALIIGLLYLSTRGDYSWAGTQNRAGMLFFVSVRLT
jgi:hypothetical protein